MKWQHRDWLLVLALLLWAVGAVPSWGALLISDPIDYPEQPFPVVSPTTARLGLTITTTVCNRESAPIVLTTVRQLVNAETGARQPIPGGFAVVRPGCATGTARQDVLPDDLAPGIYYLAGVSTVRGRWRTVDIPWRTADVVVWPSLPEGQ